MKNSADQFDFNKGELVLINKPVGWTSFDVVKKIRYAVKQKKVGHAGTLDPLATGLLIIAIGPATKQINTLQILNKTYTGTIEIGKTTPSYDLETEFDSECEYQHITTEKLKEASTQLSGEIDQIPPLFSAIKHEGKRAYKKARSGEDIVLDARKVTIEKFDITSTDLPEVHFEVKCSKGTYIRSLAHDFGKILDTGGYLKQLTRTAIGDYQLKDAYELDDFIKIFRTE